MSTPLEPYYSDYLAALKAGDGRAAARVVDAALQAGVSVHDLYLRVFQLAQWEVGRLWQRNEFTVAEEHLATAITERLMGELRPYFKPRHDRGRTLMLGCAAKEFHLVGARMLVDFFEADGWTVHFLGAATPSSDFLKLAGRYHVDLMGVSSAMYYHVPIVRELIAEARGAGLTDEIPIMVGGFPFNLKPELFEQVGAAFTAPNAAEALALANALPARPR